MDDSAAVMQRFKLGGTGLKVSHVGLGCVTFGREIDQDQSFQILDYATARGINLLDTSEAYGGREPHSSERIIGRWLRSRGCRDLVVLQSKAKRTFTRPQIREALDGSLERLQTDHLDTYLFHVYDPSTPLEESIEAMNEALDAGKIRAWGVSNWTAAQLQTAIRLAEGNGLKRPETIEPIYNLVRREIEAGLLPFCRDHGIGVTSYSPLGAVFLTGKYVNDRNAVPAGTRFDVKPGHMNIYFSEAAFEVVRRLRRISDSSGVPMVKLAMAWALHNPNVTSVLAGARTTAHIDNALEAEQSLSLYDWIEIPQAV